MKTCLRPFRPVKPLARALLGAFLSAWACLNTARADEFGVTLNLGNQPQMDLGTLSPGQGETGAVGFSSVCRTNRNLPWKVKLIVGGIEHSAGGSYLPLNLMQYKLTKSDSANGTPVPAWEVWTPVPYQNWEDVYSAAASEQMTSHCEFGFQFKFTHIPAIQRSGRYYGLVHVMMYDGF